MLEKPDDEKPPEGAAAEKPLPDGAAPRWPAAAAMAESFWIAASAAGGRPVAGGRRLAAQGRRAAPSVGAAAGDSGTAGRHRASAGGRRRRRHVRVHERQRMRVCFFGGSVLLHGYRVPGGTSNTGSIGKVGGAAGADHSAWRRRAISSSVVGGGGEKPVGGGGGCTTSRGSGAHPPPGLCAARAGSAIHAGIAAPRPRPGGPPLKPPPYMLCYRLCMFSRYVRLQRLRSSRFLGACLMASGLPDASSSFSRLLPPLVQF